VSKNSIRAILTFALLITAGCASFVDGDASKKPPSEAATNHEDPLSNLVNAIDNGEHCSELFILLDHIDNKTPQFETAQRELRAISCFTRTSERSDSKKTSEDPAKAEQPTRTSPWKGIPEGKRVTPSKNCLSSMSKAASEPNSTRAEPLIANTLGECASVNEWMSALEAHPNVMGMANGYIPEKIDITIACSAYPSATVCRDASTIGIN